MVYMLSKFLSLKRILIDAKANSLEDAILLCGNLLVGDGCATCEYPAAMVKTARQLGDAIVMAPQTALASRILFLKAGYARPFRSSG